jgi:hypothetical protein
MEAKVRFVYNKRTGAVEEFTVEQESTLPQADHNLSHDRLAAEIGGVIERTPRITEGQPSHDRDGAPRVERESGGIASQEGTEIPDTERNR